MRPPPHFVLERWEHVDGRTRSAVRGTLRYGVGVPLVLLALAMLVSAASPTTVGGAAMLGGFGLVVLLLSVAGPSRGAHRRRHSRREDALRFLDDRKP
jgi:hypothetical protein